MDIMLRANTKAQVDSALSAAGLMTDVLDAENLTVLRPIDGVIVDRIGPCGADTRYHANVRIADGVAYDATELPTFTPLPVTPYRVWFD